MDINMKRDFNVLSKSFRDSSFSLKTVSNLLGKIREYRKQLNEKQIEYLLNIVINVLENDVELRDENKWVKDNSHYFAGNITWVGDSQYFQQLKYRFETGDFSLDTIVELTQKVRDEYNVLSSAAEFLLRNPEVTIRDDVYVKKYSNFTKSGNVFADEIDKAMCI